MFKGEQNERMNLMLKQGKTQLKEIVMYRDSQGSTVKRTTNPSLTEDMGQQKQEILSTLSPFYQQKNVEVVVEEEKRFQSKRPNLQKDTSKIWDGLNKSIENTKKDEEKNELLIMKKKFELNEQEIIHELYRTHF
mmetsp:Transcript_10878/g.11012  ORF Transcript_10878/g.11012 Transcript_10878/m.11012 type:complete len:135 (-) Transcript_10878:484-888(-)